MAFTRTIVKTVHGNERVQHYVLTADAATDTIITGFGTVIAVATAPKSMASAPFSVSMNELLASTAAAGTIGVTGCTSGDDFYMTVWGR